jgi:hypothetical protein
LRFRNHQRPGLYATATTTTGRALIATTPTAAANNQILNVLNLKEPRQNRKRPTTIEHMQPVILPRHVNR